MPDEAAPGFPIHPGYELEVLACPKRVRAAVAGIVLADSRDVLLVRETRHTPVYYFPAHDVRVSEFLTPTDHHTTCPFKGEASYWTAQVGDRVLENAVWAYPDPYREAQAFKDHMAFYWDKMDVWFEEDEQVHVHPADPKARLDIRESRQPLRVIVEGEVIAESIDYRVLFETGLIPRYYLPVKDVRPGILHATALQTHCPYKGAASYWSAHLGGKAHDDLAWAYADPLPEAARIKDLVCFYQERVDAIEIDGERLPRPKSHWAATRPA